MNRNKMFYHPGTGGKPLGLGDSQGLNHVTRDHVTREVWSSKDQTTVHHTR